MYTMYSLSFDMLHMYKIYTHSSCYVRSYHYPFLMHPLATYKNEISLVDCGDPGRPANGNVSFVTTREEGVANYTCNEGYILIGVTQRTCQTNGSWSEDVPACQS